MYQKARKDVRWWKMGISRLKDVLHRECAQCVMNKKAGATN